MVLAVGDAAILTSGTSDHAARNGRRDAELGSDESRRLRRLNSIDCEAWHIARFRLGAGEFIRGSIATADRLPRSRTHLLRIVNLAISATNTNRSWGVVIMLFSSHEFIFVFLPLALAGYFGLRRLRTASPSSR